MSNKRTRDPEATRKALLKAAEAVFLEKGFGNTAVSEIAKKAGVTKSLVHHYFGSKAGLWQEVKRNHFLYYADRQREMLQQEKPGLALLLESMAFYFEFLKENPDFVRILLWMHLERDQDVCMETDRELIRDGAAKIRESQELGFIRDDIDPKFIVFVFLGLCQHWFQEKEHFKKDFGKDDLPEDLDSAYLEAILKIFTGGIAP